MLIVERTKDHMKIQSSGSLPEITEDISHVINGIYTSLFQRNEDMARMFKFALTTALSMPGSPIWEVDNKKPGTSVVIIGKDGKHDE